MNQMQGKAPQLDRALLAHTVAVLTQVLSFAHAADAVLSRYFREHRALGARDRAFIAETVYAVLRRLRWLRRLILPHSDPRRLAIAWLLRGEGLSLRQLEAALSPAEREWLPGLQAVELPAGSFADQADLPDWLAERLVAQYGEKTALELAHSLNQPAPLDIRANPLKTDRDKLLAALAASRIAAEPCALAPHGLRVVGKPALNKHPLFLDGSFEVQDEGSQLLVHLLAPRRGEMVVDFCAGAGGKTLLIGALMRSTGRLYAFDVAERRLTKLRPRAARAGLSNLHPMLIDSERDSRLKRFAGKADRVLVDAPCSGLGTLRRNPDLKWRQSPASVEELVAKQGAILTAAARLVRPGGRLVYATCSLLADENEAVVEAFLAAHPQFAPLDANALLREQGITLDGEGPYLRLSPLEQQTDGFFAAALQHQG